MMGCLLHCMSPQLPFSNPGNVGVRTAYSSEADIKCAWFEYPSYDYPFIGQCSRQSTLCAWLEVKGAPIRGCVVARCTV